MGEFRSFKTAKRQPASAMQPAVDPAGAQGPALLFASGLTVAHLYYYDETVFLLPLLVLWSHRSALGRWRVAVLRFRCCLAARAAPWARLPRAARVWPPYGGPPARPRYS